MRIGIPYPFWGWMGQQPPTSLFGRHHDPTNLTGLPRARPARLMTAPMRMGSHPVGITWSALIIASGPPRRFGRAEVRELKLASASRYCRRVPRGHPSRLLISPVVSSSAPPSAERQSPEPADGMTFVPARAGRGDAARVNEDVTPGRTRGRTGPRRFAPPGADAAWPGRVERRNLFTA